VASEVTEYECGARSGQKVRLKRHLALKGSDKTHSEGEIWSVMPYDAPKPLRFVLLQKPDGNPHIWKGESFWEWFEVQP
jgi:hypothetical protein